MSTQKLNRCEQCGEPARRRWCSQTCNAASRKRGAEHTCEQCGGTFYRRAGDVKDYDPRFCGVDCRRAHDAEHATSYPKEGKRAIHRRVAAETLGRPLAPGEVVHHVDENRRNYAPSNLRVYPSQSAHMRDHNARRRECPPNS